MATTGAALRPRRGAAEAVVTAGEPGALPAAPSPTEAERPPGARYRWAILGLATVMQIGMSMPQQTPAAIGPVLTEALELSRAQLGLLTSAIWGGMLLGMLPFGLLIDRRGERAVVALGALGLAAFLLLAAQASSFLPLFLLLIPAAVGASCAGPGGTRAITAWFPRHQRGMALGIRQTGVTAAGIISAIVLPPLAVTLGWQAPFRGVAGLALLSALVFTLFYREPRSGRRTAMSPLDLGSLLRSGMFMRATGFGWIFMGALGSAITYLTVSLHQQQGLSAVDAGFFLALLQLGGVVGRVGWGMLSDRLGSRGRTMSLAGGVTVAASLAMAALGHRAIPALPLGVLVFVLGLSAMGWNTVYIALCAEAGPVDRAATVVGLGTTVTFTGMVTVTPVFGLIADRSGGFVLSWIFLAALTLVGVLISLGVNDRASRGPRGGNPTPATAAD